MGQEMGDFETRRVIGVGCPRGENDHVHKARPARAFPDKLGEEPAVGLTGRNLESKYIMLQYYMYEMDCRPVIDDVYESIHCPSAGPRQQPCEPGSKRPIASGPAALPTRVHSPIHVDDESSAKTLETMPNHTFIHLNLTMDRGALRSVHMGSASMSEQVSPGPRTPR
jgi:hypothetical protein